MSAYIYLIGDLDFEVVRGHVSEANAREVVAAKNGWPEDGDQVKITHTYARWTKAPNDADWDRAFHISKPGPGAFKVTLLEEA